MRHGPASAAFFLWVAPAAHLPRGRMNNLGNHIGAAEFLDDRSGWFACHAANYALFAQLVKNFLRDYRTGLSSLGYAKKPHGR